MFELDGRNYCESCMETDEVGEARAQVWPCDAARLLDALRAAEARAERAEQGLPVLCSYCSFEVAAPVEARVVQEHVLNDCPHHPMRKVESALAAERERGARLAAALEEAAGQMQWMLGGWDDRHDEALPRARDGIGRALDALAAYRAGGGEGER